MVRLDELRTPLSRGERIAFVPTTTTTNQPQEQHHQQHQHEDLHHDDHARVKKPLKSLTNSPDLRPQPPPTTLHLQPPPELFSLRSVVTDGGRPQSQQALAPTRKHGCCAARGSLKEAQHSDGRGKHQARQALARAGRLHSLRQSDFTLAEAAVEKELQEVTLSLPVQQSAGSEWGSWDDIETLELSSPVVAEGSILACLPDSEHQPPPPPPPPPMQQEPQPQPQQAQQPQQPQQQPSSEPTETTVSPSWCDPTIVDSMALPLSDIVMEDTEDDDDDDFSLDFDSDQLPDPAPGMGLGGTASPQTPRNYVTIRFGSAGFCFETQEGNGSASSSLSVAQLRAQITARFALGTRSFVLRSPQAAAAGGHTGTGGSGGCIVPIAYCLEAASCGATFCLEVPTSAALQQQRDTDSCASQPPSPVDERTKLRWVQEPPHTTCHWLTAKPSDFLGQANTAPAPASSAAAAASSAMPATSASTGLHCFDPPPTVAFAAVASSSTAAELSALVAKATVTLWTPLYRDVSQHLHVGPCEVERSESSGEVCLRWPSMAITELPSNVIGEVMGSSSSVTNCHHGGRGGKGWFHLRVDVPTVGRLWLKNRGGTAPAQIVLKHRRCVETGRWREREIGPYAEHELCRLAGSHIDAETGRKLCKESCCFGARKKRKTAKAAPKAAVMPEPPAAEAAAAAAAAL